MILPDTSIWVDHFRAEVPALVRRLESNEVLMHPFVLGELLLGGLHLRREAYFDLRTLPQAGVADPDEIAILIENEGLQGQGIGYVDAALLTCARLHPGVRLWTRDCRLAAVAGKLNVRAEES